MSTQHFKVNSKVSVKWNKRWWPATVLEIHPDQAKSYRIEFESDNTFEDFTPSQIKERNSSSSSSNSSSSSSNNNNNNNQPPPSEYEVARLERIAQNNRTIAELSLRPKKRLLPKKNRTTTKRKSSTRNKPSTIPQLPERRSKRLRGEKSSANSEPMSQEEYASMLRERRQQKEAQEQRIYEDIAERWKESQNTTEPGEAIAAESTDATLFLVPTGEAGVNDHTLSTPVCDKHYLWGKWGGLWWSLVLSTIVTKLLFSLQSVLGFCVGLYSRIFEHVQPGKCHLG